MDRQINPLQKDEVQVTDQREVKKELKLMGREFFHPGHTVFELNLATDVVKPAEIIIGSRFVPQTKALPAHSVTTRRVNVKEGCFYASALNAKNARKKFAKMFFKALTTAK